MGESKKRDKFRIYLVRHGQAAANWNEDLDPGLDESGTIQALAAGQLISELFCREPCLVVSSPLRRARETAMPLAQTWQQEVVIEPRMAEVPSLGLALDERGPWLVSVMADRWPNVSAELNHWRHEVRRYLLSLSCNAVIFSHFVAINAAVGWAKGHDAVTCCRPANGSITVLESDGDALRLLSLGQQMQTQVL